MTEAARELLRQLNENRRACKGCGVSLAGEPANKKWCSNKCRQKYSYPRWCGACGEIMEYSAKGSTSTPTCKTCLSQPGPPAVLPVSYGRKKMATTNTRGGSWHPLCT